MYDQNKHDAYYLHCLTSNNIMLECIKGLILDPVVVLNINIMILPYILIKSFSLSFNHGHI